MKGRLLRTFNSEKDIVIEMNVLDHTMTGILLQEGSLMKFILYKMNKTEQNYRITKKEMLAVIQAIQE